MMLRSQWNTCLEKLELHWAIAIALCDSYTSFVLRNLPCAAISGQTSANHGPILLNVKRLPSWFQDKKFWCFEIDTGRVLQYMPLHQPKLQISTSSWKTSGLFPTHSRWLIMIITILHNKEDCTYWNCTYSSRLCADNTTCWSATLFNCIIQNKLSNLSNA